MKKTLLSIFGVVLASLSFSAVAADEPFDPSQIGNYTRSSGGRYLTSFTLHNEQDNTGGEVLEDVTIQVNQPTTLNKSLYYDLTSQAPFVTRAGNTVNFSDIRLMGDWIHGYLYIDYNNDGGFNSMLNTGFPVDDSDPRIAEALNPSEEGELVTFNYYNVDKSGVEANDYYVNSRGTHFTSPGTSPNPSNMLAFIIPSWLKPGTYYALYKHDWSNIDQHGNKDPGNLIGNNGGVIVRFTIEVVASEEIGGDERSITISNADEDKGSVYLEVDGERYEGNTIENTTSTVVAVAEPNDGCVFVNWTNGAEGEEVSTEARYTVAGEGDIELVAHFQTFEEAGIIPTEGDDIIWLSDLEGLEENMSLLEEDHDDNIAVNRDRSTAGNAITIMGKVYEKGIGTHATSNAIVELNGATAFYTVVGIDDEVAGAKNKTNECEVDFIVTLCNGPDDEGVVVFNQHVKMSEDVYAFEFNSLKSEYDLADYAYMKLTVAAGTQPWSDHADWADARFKYDSAAGAPRFINQSEMSGVDKIITDNTEAAARYYNLQGIEVAQPAAGQIYIVRQGTSVNKVLVK